MTDTRLRQWGTAVVFAIVLLNLLTGLCRQRRNLAPISDGIEYYNIAWNLAAGRGYGFDWEDPAWLSSLNEANAEVHAMFERRVGAGPTTYRPPLVPWIEAAELTLVRQHFFFLSRLIDHCIVATAIALTAAIAMRLGGAVAGLVVAVGAAWQTSFYDVLAFTSVTESVTMGLLALFIYVAEQALRRPSAVRWGMAGVIAGFLILARSQMLVFFAVLACASVLICLRQRGRRRDGLVRLAVACGMAGVVILPWSIRNCLLLHSFRPMGIMGEIGLADQYSDDAWTWKGLWTGNGLATVAAELRREPELAAKAAAAMPGVTDFTPSSTGNITTYPNDYGWANTALTSGSPELEVMIGDRLRKRAFEWVRLHPLKTAALLPLRAIRELYNAWPIMLLPVLLGLAALKVRTELRTQIRLLLLVFVCAMVMVSLTHAVGGRFLVPFTVVWFLLAGLSGAVLCRLEHDRVPPPPSLLRKNRLEGQSV